MSTQPMIEEIKGIMYADDVDWNWDMQADTLTYTNTGQLHGKIRDALDKAYTLGTQDAIEKVVKDLQTIIDEKHVDNEWRIEEIFELDELEQQKVIQSRSKNTMKSKHIQKNLEERLREDFAQVFSDKFTVGSDFPVGTYIMHREKIADWWFSKLSQALTEQHKMDVQSFREKIEGMKKEKYPGDTDASPNKTIRALGRRLDDCIKAYNKALDDLLASLDETEK